MSKNKKNMLFSGVLILTLSNIIVKVTGMLFRIPLNRIMDLDGLGYYSAASRIYTLFYTVSTVGLPIAVSRMVSEDRALGKKKETKAIINSALKLFTLIGLAGTLLMVVLPKGLVAFLKFAFDYDLQMDNTFLSVYAISPALFFICICSALRGYFQGFQYMVPTAVSEVIESLAKLILGIIFAKYAIKMGYPTPTVAAYAIFGVTVGVALGALYTVLRKLFFKPDKFDLQYGDLPEDSSSRSQKELMKAILSISIPIMLSSVVMTLADMIDIFLINGRLQGLGFTEEVASAKYGSYSSLAVPLFNLPPILIYPISASIVPYISSALAAKDYGRVRDTMTRSFKIASLIAIPSALGLAVFSKPILLLLYGAKPNNVEMAYPLLSVLAPAVFFLGLISVTNAILQATKHEKIPMISMAAGALVKIISSFILIGNRNIEIFGAPIGTFLCYFTIAMLNIIFIAKYTGLLPSFGDVFMRPFLSSVICVSLGYGLYYLLSMRFTRLATIVSIVFAVVVYGAAVLITGTITPEEIRMLPKGEKLEKIFRKTGLLRGSKNG